MLKFGQIPIGQYQQIKDLPIPDNAKEIIKSNLIDKKYREESAKIIGIFTKFSLRLLKKNLIFFLKQLLTNPSVRICKDSISASLNSSLV
jgi:hypothetical protein